MKGQQADCVTSQGSMDILTGIDNVQETAKQRDINHNTLTTVEITPVKAPNEIKSAIRRQKRTETLDYIWHALPVSRSSKPLYRAVLRGALQPGNIQYTITNVNGNSLKTSNGCHRDESSTTNNDLKGVSKTGFGLRVGGVSINEIKFQEPAGRLSPRTRSGQTLPVSRHMKQNFLEQKSSSSANGFKSRSLDIAENSPRNAYVISSTKNVHGTSPPRPSNGYGNNSKLFTLVDEESNRVTSLSPSLSPSPVGAESSKERSHLQISVGQKGKNNETTVLSLTTAMRKPNSTAGGSQIIPEREIVWHDKSGLTTSFHLESPTQQLPSELTNQATICKKSPRPADINYSTQAKESSSIRDLTCMQLADSILGAVNGDLSQVYSLCKSKLRYSDFIEQSQPHRLGDAHFCQEANVSQASDQNDLLPVQCAASAEYSQTKSSTVSNAVTSTQSPSTLEKTKEAMRLPVIKASPKSYQHVTSRYLNFSSSKIIHMKESEIDQLHSQLEAVDSTITLGKAGRPILKTFKSDVESNSTTKDDPMSALGSLTDKKRTNSMDTNNNTNGVPSNRLVRFNTCHEVREFTPSEPIKHK